MKLTPGGAASRSSAPARRPATSPPASPVSTTGQGPGRGRLAWAAPRPPRLDPNRWRGARPLPATLQAARPAGGAWSVLLGCRRAPRPPVLRSRGRRLVHPSITRHPAAPQPSGGDDGIPRGHTAARYAAAPIPQMLGREPLVSRPDSSPFDSLEHPGTRATTPEPALAAAPVRTLQRQHPRATRRTSGRRARGRTGPHRGCVRSVRSGSPSASGRGISGPS